jgi:cob(I)alamin adenosyltransferase
MIWISWVNSGSKMPNYTPFNAISHQNGYNFPMPNPHPHTGDSGMTGMLGKGRLPKYHLRIETLGAIDEATAALGLARATTQSEEMAAILMEIQRDLYTLMAQVAATPENAGHFKSLDEERLKWLNSRVALLEAQVPAANQFILPGDSLSGAACSLARTVVRRAERWVAKLIARKLVTNQVMLPYLNRLSTFCFLLELYENKASGQKTSLAKE